MWVVKWYPFGNTNIVLALCCILESHNKTVAQILSIVHWVLVAYSLDPLSLNGGSTLWYNNCTYTIVTVLYCMYFIECCEHWYDFTALSEWRHVEGWFAYARRKALCAVVARSYIRTRFIVNTCVLTPFITEYRPMRLSLVVNPPLEHTNYTSCRRGVRTWTEVYCFAFYELKSTVCFALCELKSTVLHVLSTRSPQWNWSVLFRLVRTEVNCMFRPVRIEVNCITRLVDAESAVELKCIVSPCANWSQLYVSPCANWSQLYYTSCRRGVRSGTEATLLASVPT